MASSHPTIDSSVAAILDRPPPSKQPTSSSRSPSPAPSPTSSDASLDALLSDPTSSALRAARLQQLASESARLASLRNTSSHGSLSLLAEKPAMDAVSAAPFAVMVFTHADFGVAVRMQEVLAELAGWHPEARFVGVGAEEAKWLAGKMGVRVLPVVVGFEKGEEVGRCVGWEGVSGGEKGGTAGVEEMLVRWGVLARAKVGMGREREREEESDGEGVGVRDGRRGIRQGKVGRGKEDNDEDWEWD